MRIEIDKHHPIQLIVQYYRCTDPARQEEIDTCLRNNLINTCISTIHLLTEEPFDFSDYPGSDKILQTVVGERLTFERAFRYANDADPEGQLVWMLSNADIYFDETLSLVEWENLDGVVYALTRHDVQVDGEIKLVDTAFAHGCQDAWFFKCPLPLSRMFTQFYLGIPGCDNRIANEFIQSGYKLINPAYLLRALHLDLTREVDIWERDKEYALLKTGENVVNGQVAPPPHQYHIYPVDQLNPDSPETYQAHIRHLSELGLKVADRDRKLLQQFRQMEELYRQIADNTSQIVELSQLLSTRDCKIAELDSRIASLINSTSWKITSPLRKVLDFFKAKRQKTLS